MRHHRQNNAVDLREKKERKRPRMVNLRERTNKEFAKAAQERRMEKKKKPYFIEGRPCARRACV